MKHFPWFLISPTLLCLFLMAHGGSSENFESSTFQAEFSDTFSQKTTSNGKLTTEENEELQNRCGYYPVSKKKSVDSVVAFRKQAPWVVALAYIAEDNTTDIELFCSGTLISNRHVLTSWRCAAYIDSSDILRKKKFGYFAEEVLTEESGITFDNFRFVFDDDCSASNTLANCSIENALIRNAVEVISPKIFPKKHKVGTMDLAVFELDYPVDFSPQLYPACFSETAPSVSDELDLYSFGSDLRDVEYTLNGAFQHIQVTTEACIVKDAADSICIKNSTKSSGSGDSGGGLIYKKYGKRYVTGVVSGEDPRGIRKDVAVANHLRWICKHTGICVNETRTKQITTNIDTITLS